MRGNQIDGSETGEVPMSHSFQPLQARIQAYLAVAGLSFAGTAVPPASADIIAWSDANLVVPSTLDGLYINVETRLTGSAGSVVSGWDLNPNKFTGLTWFNATGTGAMRYPGLTTGSAGNLPLGTEVGPTASFGFGDVAVGFNRGEWQLNASNYFGFRFLASDGLTRYGWGRFVIGSSISGSDRFIAEICFEGVAGQPIAVDAGACAEPLNYFVDADGDGFGTVAEVSSCVPLAGRVVNADDCDDSLLLYSDLNGDGFDSGDPVACGILLDGGPERRHPGGCARLQMHMRGGAMSPAQPADEHEAQAW
jgi:hypothetical protein